MNRFVSRFRKLEENLKQRLVIENDDRCYNLKDCIQINNVTEIPVLFDSFHHKIYNSGEKLTEAFELFTKTWRKKDGIPIVDYSSQQIEQKKGKHAETLDTKHFKHFLRSTSHFDYDLMLEIKDKEHSALKAIKIAKQTKDIQLASGTISDQP